jgi:hypothetical protein
MCTSVKPNPTSRSTISRLKPSATAKNGLEILHGIFNLDDCAIKAHELSEVVLIAIDFENLGYIKRLSAYEDTCQVGLAILDTKKIHDLPPGSLIVTYNFATGTPECSENKYHKFIFGDTIIISPSDITARIRAFLPPFRNLVFVGHRIHNDIQALRVLDFRLSRSLAYILDTDSVVTNVLGTWHGSLGAYCKKWTVSSTNW